MTTNDNQQSDVYTRIKQMVNNEMRGLHTASLAVVQEVDHKNQRVEVAMKEDENLFIGDVPLASIFARSGEGVVTPLEPDDEGILLHPREPLYNKQTARGHAPTEVNRHHTLEDAIFFPMFFYGEDTVPPYDDGQIRIYMKDAPPTEGPKPSIDIRIDPYDPGEVEILIMDKGKSKVKFLLTKTGFAEVTVFDSSEKPVVKFELSDSGTATVTAFSGGSPTTVVTVKNDGSTTVENVSVGTKWEMAADGLVKINGTEVMTKDAVIQNAGDTFLGTSPGAESSIDKSGQ